MDLKKILLIGGFIVIMSMVCLVPMLDGADAAIDGTGTQQDPITNIDTNASTAWSTFTDGSWYYINQGTDVDIRNELEYHASTSGDPGLIDASGTVSGTVVSSNQSFTITLDYDDPMGTQTKTINFVSVATFYTVTFTAGQGGTVSQASIQNVPYGSIIYDSGNTVTIDNTTVTATASTGYLFDSWTNASGTVTSDMTITANFGVPYTYTLSFDANGGSGAPATMTYGPTTDTSHVFTIPLTEPTRTGYNFLGWAVSDQASTPNCYPGDTYYLYTGDTRLLYAVWETATYTVYFTAGTGGSVTASSIQNVPYGTAITVYDDSVTIGYDTIYADASTGYTFSSWSNASGTVTADRTITANFTINTYTITWENWDGTALETDTGVAYGATPSYDGATPTRSATAQYTYTFSGWSPTISTVTSDQTYTAQFSSSVNTYTVSFTAGTGGSVSQASISNVPYGSAITVNGSSVTINGTTVTATAGIGYSFDSWSNASGTVTADRTITASFTAIPNYTVSFSVFQTGYGTVDESSITVPQGTTWTVSDNVITFSSGDVVTATPSQNTAQYSYSFVRWLYSDYSVFPVSGTVTANIGIMPEFVRLTNTYTVTFTAGTGGTVSQASIQNVPYGTAITVSSNTVTIDGTTVTATAGIGYSFDSWSNATGTVTGNRTITANFTINTYTITWENWDGTVLETDTGVAFGTIPSYDGSTPTRPATAQYTYSFSSWDPFVYSVSGDQTYTAQYASILNEYTVSFTAGVGGSVSQASIYYVPYGTAITVSSNTVTIDGTTVTATAGIGYSFDSWSNATGTVTGNRTITASFTAVTLTEIDMTASDFWAGFSEFGVYFIMQGAPVHITDSEDHHVTGTTEIGLWISGGTLNGNVTSEGVSFTITVTYDNEGSPQTKTITLVGVASFCTVTFTAGTGGTVSQASIQNVPYGTAISVSSNAVTIDGTTVTATASTGYLFGSWTNASGPVTSDMTITANFLKLYTVTFNAKEAGYGTVDESSITVPSGTTWTVSDNVITFSSGDVVTATATPDTAQYTYTFLGWRHNNGNPLPASGTITADKTITASFMRATNHYTITWENWDSTILETDLNVAYGQTPHYNGQTPTRPDDLEHSYTFSGWDPEPATVTGNQVYVAQFTAGPIQATYTLVFNGNGGSGVPATITDSGHEISVSFTIPNVTPSRSGWLFMGWSTAASATAASYAAGSSITVYANETVTLYAIWQEENPVTLSFDNFIKILGQTFFGGSTAVAGLVILIVMWLLAIAVLANIGASPVFSVVPMIPATLIMAAYNIVSPEISILIILTCAILSATAVRHIVTR